MPGRLPSISIRHAQTQIARGWFDLPYPTFKRLALFAASQDGCIAPDIWVDWLLAEDSWWLWSERTRRETMRLLVLQGSHLSQDARAKLEAAILAGPPRAMYRDDIQPDDWKDLMNHGVWLRLAKLQASGDDLGQSASGHLSSLSAAKPEWELAVNESDEFSLWMSGTRTRGLRTLSQYRTSRAQAA